MAKADLTPAQEKFAREVVRIGSYSHAYRNAYKVKPTTKPESVHRAASEAANLPKIASRISALREAAAQRAVVTRATMLQEMEENRAFAMMLDNPSVAQSASRDRAKVAGLLVDEHRLTGKDGAAIQVQTETTIEERSANDLARKIAFALAEGMALKSTE